METALNFTDVNYNLIACDNNETWKYSISHILQDEKKHGNLPDLISQAIPLRWSCNREYSDRGKLIFPF